MEDGAIPMDIQSPEHVEMVADEALNGAAEASLSTHRNVTTRASAPSQPHNASGTQEKPKADGFAKSQSHSTHQSQRKPPAKPGMNDVFGSLSDALHC